MNTENINNSRTTTEPSSSVPLKRKRDQTASTTSKPPNSSSASASTSTKQRTSPSTATAKHTPQNANSTSQNGQEGSSPPASVTEQVRCICGFTHDDGWSIGCDRCLLWSHTVCMGFTEKDKENLPDAWLCWECKPREMDADRARRIQRGRLGLGPPVNLEEYSVNKRRSPGVERGRGGKKPISTAEGSRRRRVASAAGLVGIYSTTATTTNPAADDEHVSIDDDEPSLNTYIDIVEDIIPQPETRDRLRRQAHNWRGVTAISSSSTTPGPSTIPYPYPPPITDHPISVHPLSDTTTSPFIPPSYTLHATRPIPSSHFITTYPAVITPTAEYLKNPLNSYALLGMPKQHVHLMGPPLDVALDARWCGGKGRWVRSGCKPNAVIKPVVCRFKRQKGKGKGKEKARDVDGDVEMEGDSEEEELGNEILSFALFALKDLKAQDEVVLGWEWDDGNVVHQLPDLLAGGDTKHGSQDIPHIKAQMANILHNLESNFTSCACGESTTCVLKKMREFVDSPDPPPPPNPSPAMPMPMYIPPPFPPNGYLPPHQFYHHPYPPFSPHHLQHPYPFPFPPHPHTPTSHEPEGEAEPEEEPPPPETPITSLPRQLRYKAPQALAQTQPSRTSPPPPSHPHPPPTSAPPQPFVQHPPPFAPFTTMASFASLRRVSEASSTSSQDETKEIWGSKTRLTARQKHPTLNLDLGPLIGAKRGFKTKERERRRGSTEVGGWEGCEMWPGEEAALPSLEELRIRRKEKEKERLEEEDEEDEEDGEEQEEKEVGKDGRVIHRRGRLTNSLDGGYWGTGSARGKGRDKSKAKEQEEQEAGSRSRKTRARKVQPEPELEERMDMDVDTEPAVAAEDHIPSPPPSPPPPPLTEDRMPHKMRKKKIQMEALAYAKSRSDEAGADTDAVVTISDPSSSLHVVPTLDRTPSQLEMPPPPVPVPSLSILEQPGLTLATPSATPTPPPPSHAPEAALPAVSANKTSPPPPSTPPPVATEPQASKSPSSPTTSVVGEPMSISPSSRSHSLSPLHVWEPISRILKQEMLEADLTQPDDKRGSGDVEVDNQSKDEAFTIAPSSPLSSPPPDDMDISSDSADVAVPQVPAPRDTPEPTVPSILIDSSTLTKETPVVELQPAILLKSPRAASERGASPLPSPEPQTNPVPPSPPPPTHETVTSQAPPPIQSPQSLLTPTIPVQVPTSLNPSQSPSMANSPQLPLHSPLMPMSPNSPLIDSPSTQKKQKISLKDFALRRKKMREAEAAAVEEKKEHVKESPAVDGSKDLPETVKQPAVEERNKEVVEVKEVQVEPEKVTIATKEEVTLEQGELKEDEETTPNSPMIPPVTVLSPPPPSPSISDIGSSRSSKSRSARSESPGPLPDVGPPIRLFLPDPSPNSPASPFPFLRHPPPNLMHKLPARPSVPIAAPPPPIASSSMTVASIAHPSLLPHVKSQREDEDTKRRRANEAEMERIDRERIESDNRWMRRNNDRRREWDARDSRERDWDRDKDWSLGRDRASTLDYGRQSRSPSPPRKDIRRRSMSPQLWARQTLYVDTGPGQKLPPWLRLPPSPGRLNPASPPALSNRSSTSVFFSDSRTASPAPGQGYSDPGHPVPLPSLSTNPKWTSTNMVATETKGPSSLSLFNRASRFSPLVPSSAPAFVSSSSSASSSAPLMAAPSLQSTATRSTTPAPLLTAAQRSKSPPTQPRSFSSTKAKEPPKGPRALMAQMAQMREWDRDKVFGSAFNNHGSVFGNAERK